MSAQAKADTLVDHVQDEEPAGVEGKEPVEQTTAEPAAGVVGKGSMEQTAAEPTAGVVGKGPVEQTAAEPTAGVVGKGPVEQTAAEPTAGVVVGKGPVEQTAAAGMVKDVDMSSGYRSLDSMTTLSWGRSLSNIQDVIGATPMKQQAPFDELVMELRNQLVRAFADGASKDDHQGRQVLGDIVMDWVIEVGKSELTQQRGAAEMCEPASECLEACAALKDLSQKVAALQEQLAAKMAHADQAVTKALASVVQHAGPANSMCSSSTVTQRMALWKKSLRDEGMKEIQQAKDQQQTCVQRLESGVDRVLTMAFGDYERDRPKTEDELVQQMIKEVESHMSALQLTNVDASSGGGTGEPSMDATLKGHPASSAPADDTRKDWGG